LWSLAALRAGQVALGRSVLEPPPPCTRELADAIGLLARIDGDTARAEACAALGHPDPESWRRRIEGWYAALAPEARVPGGG
jgi:hypothetical protein